MGDLIWMAAIRMPFPLTASSARSSMHFEAGGDNWLLVADAGQNQTAPLSAGQFDLVLFTAARSLRSRPPSPLQTVRGRPIRILSTHRPAPASCAYWFAGSILRVHNRP